MIIDLQGDSLNVTKNDHYRVVEWNDHGRVVFSLTRKGKAMLCHFGAEKKALRYLQQAFNDFIEWVFDCYQWCTMILATIVISKPSIVKLVKKCHFKYVSTVAGGSIYTRLRNG